MNFRLRQSSSSLKVKMIKAGFGRLFIHPGNRRRNQVQSTHYICHNAAASSENALQKGDVAQWKSTG